MKLIASLYRTVTVPTSNLIAAAQIDEPSGDINTIPGGVDQISAALKDEFYPFAPRFKLFWGPRMTLAGIEAMSFNIEDKDRVPTGIVTADPMKSSDVERIDGALESELGRLGITIDPDEIAWRMHYEVKGN